MPFTFKLAKRLARIRGAVAGTGAAALLLTACELQRPPVTGTDNAVTQVIVSPDTITLDPLQSHQFQVFGRTQAGDSVPVSVRWTSTAGPITQNGMYTADTSIADVTVTATLADSPLSGSSRVRKGRVVQVVVTPAAASVAAGGAQQFAAYGVKNSGDSVGVAVTYTATGGTISSGGLYAAGQTAGTYRVIVRLTNGSLTDTAAVTVTAVSPPLPPPVASVTVTPATADIVVGATQQFTATLRDARGNVLTGRTVTWGSSSPSIATISGGGLASGLVAGTATMTATSEGQSGTATLTVSVTPPPPPPPGSWPNEPAGFTVLTDEPFNALVENGWHQVQRQTTNGSGLFLSSDLTAPLSASTVLQFKYAQGYTGGSEPGVEYYNPGSAVKETYFAFWWKPSSPWQNHGGSNVNKLAFLFPSAGCIYIMMYGEGGGYTIQVEPEFSGDVRRLAPNVTATPVALGAWHRVEWYVKYSSTGSSRDGVARWWLDGVLQGDYRDLQMPADAGFIEYQLAPTWGGINGTKTETDYYWFDHARISKR